MSEDGLDTSKYLDTIQEEGERWADENRGAHPDAIARGVADMIRAMEEQWGGLGNCIGAVRKLGASHEACAELRMRFQRLRDIINAMLEDDLRALESGECKCPAPRVKPLATRVGWTDDA